MVRIGIASSGREQGIPRREIEAADRVALRGDALTPAACEKPVLRSTAQRTWRPCCEPRTEAPSTDARLTDLATPPARKCAGGLKEIFRSDETVGGVRKTRYRGLELVNFAGYLGGAAYNTCDWLVWRHWRLPPEVRRHHRSLCPVIRVVAVQ
jgi:hypothetical protein